MNNCYSDVADIDWYPNYPTSLIVSPTPTDLLGKTKSKYISQSYE